MTTKKLTIKQSILWNTWGSLVYLGVQWLQTVLVARMLGYEDAGTFSLAMSITNIFYALSVYGMRNFQVSDIDEKYTSNDYVFSRVVTGAGSLLLCVGFVILNRYNFQQTVCITAYMIFKLSEIIFDVFSGFYQKRWRMDILGKSMTMRAVIMLCVFPGVMVLTHNLLYAIIAMSVGAFCVIFFYDIKKTRELEKIKCKMEIQKVRQLLVECFPLAIYSVLSTSIGSIPRYFLELYQGNEILGIYASVATPTLIVQMAATYIFNPMVTVFAECLNKKDKNRFVKTLSQCLLTIACVSAIALVGGKVFGRLGLSILYGEDIVRYEYLLLPLIVCTITTAGVWLFCGILTVTRNFKALLIGNGCAALCSIVLSVVMITRWGMQGATYALLLGNVVGIIISVYYIIRDIKKMR